jgi:hypothetical protein
MNTLSVHAIGATAGTIWKFLDRHGGQARLAAVRREVAVPEPLLLMAVGWLAREGKLDIRQEARVVYVTVSWSATCCACSSLTRASRLARP